GPPSGPRPRRGRRFRGSIVCFSQPLGPGSGATIPPMGQNDRFEELATSVGGFYRSWVIYLGLELGLFERIRASGTAGLAAPALAAAANCRLGPIEAWVRAAHAGDLIELHDSRAIMTDAVAAVLLDDTPPE